MSQDTVRVGFVGAGGIARNPHMPALQKIEGVEIVAVCDTVEAHARQAVEAFGGKPFTDPVAMLEEVEMDAPRTMWICSVICLATSKRSTPNTPCAASPT